MCQSLGIFFSLSLIFYFFFSSLEVGLPSATKQVSTDWFQGAYWWFHNLGTGTQKAWPPLGSARQPSQRGGLHLLAWEKSSCRIKAHSPTHWSLSWKQCSPPSLAASSALCALWGNSAAIENGMAHTLGLRANVFVFFLLKKRRGMGWKKKEDILDYQSTCLTVLLWELRWMISEWECCPRSRKCCLGWVCGIFNARFSRFKDFLCSPFLEVGCKFQSTCFLQHYIRTMYWIAIATTESMWAISPCHMTAMMQYFAGYCIS